MGNKIFFFDISRIDITKAVLNMVKVFPDAENKFSISRSESNEGFDLNCPDNAEWIFWVGQEYFKIITEATNSQNEKRS